MYFIGVDLGTSAVKIILTDENMNIVKTVSKSYSLFYSADGKSEQNPFDWWEETSNGIKELCKDIYKDDVSAIGVGGQMHGLVMLDEFGNVLRPAILWNDTRTSKETKYLNEEIGKEKLQELTGNIAFDGFTITKILWVQKNQPEIFEKCKKILLPKDYINFKLTGEYGTDVSDASGTLLFDVKSRKWSEEMLKISGVKKEQLPKVFESSEKIGTIKTEVAKEFGFSPDVVVAAGAGDNAAAAIGTGTTSDGACNISLGTSGTVFFPMSSYCKTKNPAIHSFCHANGKYHLMGCMLSAASCNKWLVENVFDSNDFDFYLNNEINPQNQLYFMPYLAGERCPHNDGKVRGAFIGLSLETDQKMMSAAVLEGISFGIRDCVELAEMSGAKVSSATVCGGGTKSKVWMQLLSNILNLKLEVIDNEGPALGGAILAANAVQRYVQITPKVKEVFTPQEEISGFYDKKYKKFKELYPLLNGFYKERVL